MHEVWLSNTYVVADEPGGTAVFVDSGGHLWAISARDLVLPGNHIPAVPQPRDAVSSFKATP